MKPKYIWITVSPPDEEVGYAGSIEEAWYVVDDGTVVLTDRDGSSLGDRAHKLEPGEDPRLVAARLLRERLNTRGSGWFSQPIRYPRQGIV